MDLTISKNSKFESPICFFGWTTNENVRKKSSSGGIFFEIASRIISEGGIVCGAGFDQNNSVKFFFANDMPSLERLMGSKYVQATGNGIYLQIKNFLESGKKVLFSATPCQCNALSKFLGNKRFDSLLIIDFICHGVPNDFFWQNYLSFETRKKAIENISFRDKSFGWRNFGLKITFSDETFIFSPHRENKYMQLFLENVILRPSCYSCKAKGNERCSDITLGDYWGHRGDENDGGCSEILINTYYGMKAFSKITHALQLQKMSFNEAVENNYTYFHSVGKPFIRAKTINRLITNPEYVFSHTAHFTSVTLFEKGIRRLIRIINEKKSKLLAHRHGSYLSLNCRHKYSFREKALCCGCGACQEICPKQIIDFEIDFEKFHYPIITDSEKCIHCNLCRKVCPFNK